MRTFSNRDFIYIGKEAGKEILSRIKSAKSSVKIVSPYLSADYIQELINLHKEGKEITLITCDDLVTERSPYSDFNASDLINKKRIPDLKADKLRKVLFRISILLFIASPVSLVLSLTFIFVGLFLFGLIALLTYFFIKPYSYQYSTIFRIKVFDSKSGEKPWSAELIHSKIFVIDNEIAFLGSANFTYSGFKKHYETIIRVEDKKAVQSISQEVEDLYNSTQLKTKSIEGWTGLNQGFF